MLSVAADFHRTWEFNGAALDSRDDMSRLEDYLFSLTSASRQGSRREKLAIIHQPDLFRGTVRKSAQLCYTWADIGTHTVTAHAVFPTPRGSGKSINDSCSVTASLAFDGLPFIELSPLHETVISQWNYGREHLHGPREFWSILRI